MEPRCPARFTLFCKCFERRQLHAKLESFIVSARYWCKRITISTHTLLRHYDNKWPNRLHNDFGNQCGWSFQFCPEVLSRSGHGYDIQQWEHTAHCRLTNKNNVYYAQGQYDPHSAKGIAGIGHEVGHEKQYSENGNLRFKAKYLFSSAIQGVGVTLGSRGSVMPRFDNDKAYYGNKYEQEAYKKEKEILEDLDKPANYLNSLCP